MAVLRFTNFFSICEVPQAARCQFRLNNVIFGNKKCCQAGFCIDCSGNAAGPCFVKIDPINSRQNINSDWFPSETKKFIRIGEISFCDV